MRGERKAGRARPPGAESRWGQRRAPMHPWTGSGTPGPAPASPGCGTAGITAPWQGSGLAEQALAIRIAVLRSLRSAASRI